jgi:DNA repair protein RecO (recombination protein O)
MRIVTSPGILLRSHPYSETSSILRFLTPDFGVISLLGKGVRRSGGRSGGAPELLGEGVITFVLRGDRDLHSLREFQAGGGSLELGRDVRRFLGGTLLAEILLGHALSHGDPLLYDWVRTVLARLRGAQGTEVPGWILAGGWRMLAQLGFPPGLEACVRCGESLERGGAAQNSPEVFDRFDAAAGGLRCGQCAHEGIGARVGPEARSQLQRLVRGEPPHPLLAARGHLNLLEAFCLHHVAPGRGFQTFRMLRPLLET